MIYIPLISINISFSNSKHRNLKIKWREEFDDWFVGSKRTPLMNWKIRRKHYSMSTSKYYKIRYTATDWVGITYILKYNIKTSINIYTYIKYLNILFNRDLAPFLETS